MTWAALWRMMRSPSGSRVVISRTAASAAMGSDRSVAVPFTSTATHSRQRPSEMLFAICSPVTGPSKVFVLLSGSVMVIMLFSAAGARRSF